MKSFLFVFIGGGLGSACRYAMQLFVQNCWPERLAFPLKTFLVNIIGSLLAGLVVGHLLHHQSVWMPLLLVIGFCGGFTTFSAFSVDIVQLLQCKEYGIASLYILLSVVCCVVMTAIGIAITK